MHYSNADCGARAAESARIEGFQSPARLHGMESARTTATALDLRGAPGLCWARMRDLLFFPLAAVSLAAMIWAAIAPGPARLEAALAPFRDPYAGLQIEDERLAMFQAPEGLSMDIAPLETGESAARMAAFRPDDQPPFSQGIFITLAPEFAEALSGRTVRISVRARAAAENGAPVFGVAYFSAIGQASSGWLEAELTPQFRTYAFDWAVPPPSGEPPVGVDAIGIWPDPEGRGRMLEMLSLSARIVSDDEPPPVALRGDENNNAGPAPAL